jgi:hypothetical protein
MSNNIKPDNNRVVQRPLNLPVLYIRYQSRGLSAGFEELNHTRNRLLGEPVPTTRRGFSELIESRRRTRPRLFNLSRGCPIAW